VFEDKLRYERRYLVARGRFHSLPEIMVAFCVLMDEYRVHH